MCLEIHIRVASVEDSVFVCQGLIQKEKVDVDGEIKAQIIRLLLK